MADARSAFAEFREDNLGKELTEKDQTAFRKLEDAQVKSRKGDIQAESLYQEAIALWEEVFPKALNEKYRKEATGQLAAVYLELGDLQHASANQRPRRRICKSLLTMAKRPWLRNWIVL